MTRLVKLLATSVAAGLAAVALVVIVGLTIALALLWWNIPSSSTGAAGIGAISVGVSNVLVVIVFVLAFLAGFLWQFRRASRT